MLHQADKFFRSLGLPKLTKTFYAKSILEKPNDGRIFDCQAASSDFCTGKSSQDFRIQMCAKVTQEDLITLHHELGHIQYFQHYTHLRRPFRDSANPGFSEAIGDALALAVVTPKHLQCVLNFSLGLDLDCNPTTSEGQNQGQPLKKPNVTSTDLNALFSVALDKIAFIPFLMAYTVWRYQVFDEKIKPEEYGGRWWDLLEEYQELKLPNKRDRSRFDPGAKYHIAANVDFVRYFFSIVVQFSFYEAMCKAAGEFNPDDPGSNPLYQCDFTGSKAGGKLLSNMLRLGSSEPWPEALEQMTGSRQLSAGALLHYFKPLVIKMESELKLNGEMECLENG